MNKINNRTKCSKTQTNEFHLAFQKAIDEEQFVLYLQPKFNTHENRFYNAGVLIRWQNPEKGLLEPKDFLPQCEENNLMTNLDFYIWEHACKIIKQWENKGFENRSIAVKVSSQSLYCPELIQKFSELLDKYQILNEQFHLEIEEDSIRLDLSKSKEIIHNLHTLGFKIVLVDYCYGCSSLSALNQIDVDILKVDMSFFNTCAKSGRGEVLLASMIKTLNILGIAVIGECIETKLQNDFAVGCGCDYIQGFYHCPPIFYKEFEEKYLIDYSKEDTIVEAQTVKNHTQTVLIIDDLEIERSILNKYLSDQYNVFLCDSAETGIDYLLKNKNTVNLVLVDYIMPGMSGLEFLQYCQFDDNLRNIPKIMITSNECAEDQVIAFKSGAVDYLLKPLIPELIKIRVRNAIDSSQRLINTEQKKEEFAQLAQLDQATGLFNKKYFQSKTENCILKHKDSTFILLILDIDNFKGINDNYGHLTGDKIIKLISSELQACFRSKDLIGRFGGDEFVVFMIDDIDQDLVEKKASDLILKVYNESTKSFGFSVSLSIGIAFGRKSDKFQDAFERADEALYKAKNSGKGRLVSSR